MSGAGMRGGPVEIVCLATRRLDDPMPTIVQHLMRALAERVRVLYVEPPVDPVFLARRRLRPRPGRHAGPAGITRAVPLVMPFASRVPRLAGINDRLVSGQVRRWLRAWRRDQTVLWLPTPRLAPLSRTLGEIPLCYYLSDDYRVAPSVLAGTTPAAVAAADEDAFARASWVLINSLALFDRLRTSGGRVWWVPSGVDLAHYRGAAQGTTPIASDLAAVPRPIAGFVGALDAYKVDLALLERCARALPDVSFVTVGPAAWIATDGPTRLPQGPNLHHLGRRPYASLPGYLAAFDVAILPSRTTGYMAENFPMKLFEYFAAGVPVVATDVASLAPFRSWLRIARTPEAFVAAVRAAIGDRDGAGRREAIAVAARNTWAHQAARVLDIFAGRTPEPVLPAESARRSQTGVAT